MKRVFLYEFVTGGGFLELEGRPLPEGSMLTEGEAMWRAVFDDFASIETVQLHSLRDARLPSPNLPGVEQVEHFPQESFFNLAMSCDYCLLIAPEFDGLAFELAHRVEQIGTKLLSPSSDFIRITSDKTKTASLLSNAGVNVPQGECIPPGQTVPDQLTFPRVIKRNDGAGSMAEVITKPTTRTYPYVTRVEQKVNGITCSISFLCSIEHPPIACPPMRQILSGDGQLSYLGGRRMTESTYIQRATSLGRRVIEVLPPTTGYVGIDLVLSENARCDSNDDDYVIEVNPRLTTSYIGLRQIAQTNLAAAMMKLDSDAEVSATFSNREIQFQADGTII